MSNSVFPPEVLNPQKYLEPQFHLSPFTTSDLAKQLELQSTHKSESIEDIFAKKTGFSCQLTFNGREAIHLCLYQLNLKPEDEVLILTTSGQGYISSCVTEQVKIFCQWSLTPSALTKACIVIHDFGFPFLDRAMLLKLNVPIIEDCAYLLGHVDDPTFQWTSDYYIYSLSKAFPLQFGGLALSTKRPIKLEKTKLSLEGRSWLQNSFEFYWSSRQSQNQRRVDLFNRYKRKFAEFGFKSKYEMKAGCIPHAFVVDCAEREILEKMKPILNRVGIESSLYYNCDGYFLPLHFNLKDNEVDLIVATFANIYFRLKADK